MSAPRSPAWTTCDNPDYLALLLCALHDLRNHRLPLPQAAVGRTLPDDKLLKPYASVLDSLARILLCEKTQQVVAVAFKPAREPEEPPMFILAQNNLNVSTKVDNHLRSLLHRLRKIRELHQNIYHSHSPPDLSKISITSEGDRKLRAAYTTGELRVLFYSRRKLERRFTKNNRYKSFLNLVADVRGPAADQRPDFGENEEARQALKLLQGLNSADRNSLLRVGEMIERIRDIFASERQFSDAPKPTQDDLNMLVHLQSCYHVVVQNLVQLSSIWPRCDGYLHAWPKLRQHGAVTEVPFDVGKWLGKVVSVSRDYMRILHVAQSPTMAAVLFDGPLPEVKVASVTDSKPPPVTLTISKHAVKSTLAEAGWTDIADDVYAECVDSLFRNLLSQLEPPVPPDTSTSSGGEDSVTGTLRAPVHCECALLAHLHDSGDVDSVLPYVGLSKPPCGLCSTYFECYRAATRSVICTQGTHGKPVGQWRTPSLSRDSSSLATVDTDVRKRLCETLMERLKRAAAEARASMSPQSTVSSEPSVVQFRSDVGDEEWEAEAARILSEVEEDEAEEDEAWL